MSGAAGGSRINKENLKATIRDYRDNVLKPLGLDKSYDITGIRSRPEKNIFGDIDIVVSFPEGDKSELKKKLGEFLDQINQIPVIPKKGKKYFIHGNIVSTLYPIQGKEGEYVQIDNIVTVSKEEGKFTYKMLDLPAQEQVLAIGLVKAIFTELDEAQIEKLFKDLNIPDTDKPGEGEEYDFNLNPSELSLKIVPIGKSGGREIWKSNNFKDVKTLLSYLDIDIEKDKFDSIISKIKKFKNRRSIDRLKGMFAKNIRVGDAEAGTEKGDKKQQALDTVSSLEEKYDPLVLELIRPFLLEDENKKTIAVFPGKFKPPHKDHIARIKAASADADEVIVIVSPKTEPGGTAVSKKKKEELEARLGTEMPITLEQSLELFKKLNLPSNIKVIAANDPSLPVPSSSPVSAAYELFINNPQQQYIAIFGKEEDLNRFGQIPQNVTVKNYSGAAGNLSATDLRTALKKGEDIKKYMPDGITPEEYKSALGLEEEAVNEVGEANVEPYKWEETDKGEYRIDAKFKTDNKIEYIVNLYIDDYEGLKAIEVEFTAKSENDKYPSTTTVTNKDEMYRVMATITSIIKKYIEEYKIQAIIYSPSKKSDKEDDFNNQRDKLYKAFISKTFPNVEYKTSKQGRIAMLPNVNEGTCGYDTNAETGEKLDTPGGISETDPKTGTGKKPKGSGRRLYTDEDPSDTVKVKFSTKQDIIDTLSKESFKSKSHARQSQIINLIHQRVRAAYERAKDPEVKSRLKNALEYAEQRKEASKEKTERLHTQKENVAPNHSGKSSPYGSGYKPLILEISKFMINQGMEIQPLPKVQFIDDDADNAQDILGTTAYYNPQSKTIVLYTLDRHPKDILRSFCHEMVHHEQNIKNTLGNIKTQNTTEDSHLDEIEREAYERGNIMFRNWTDSLSKKTWQPKSNVVTSDPGGLDEIEDERETRGDMGTQGVKYTIYCDMDGVLCDFDKRFMEFSNGIPPSRYESEFGKKAFWKLISGQGVKFWVDIPWMSNGKQLWDYIKSYNPSLLSAPSMEESSRSGKRLWVDNEIPGTKLILRSAEQKQEFAKPNAILIDDRPSNIEQWRAKGGIGILHTSANKTIEQLKELGL